MTNSGSTKDPERISYFILSNNIQKFTAMLLVELLKEALLLFVDQRVREYNVEDLDQAGNNLRIL
jgi:hypothetical protein